ncbi:MAG: hypothetical protein H0T42_17315 [Deltaproteobacteria bacterium]|nr:hypothetical protein [Deltaproteobacteria bacterium]
MKRIIPMALIALTLTGGVALADRGRWRDTSDRPGGTIVTPTYRGERHYDRRHDNRRYNDPRTNHRHRVVTVQRARPAFRNNRFYFSGGHYRHYQRPVIQYRYRNYYQRPAVIVENMQPVAGYVWSPGKWEWDGYEWQWVPGHYDIDSSYQEPYYDGYQGSYQDTYQDNYQEPVYYNNNTYQAPTVQGGIQIQGRVNF